MKMARSRENAAGPYIDFGKRFSRALNESGLSGLSYKELAKKFKVTAPSIGNWINGDKLPSMDSAITIAVVTGVSVDWLMTGRGSIVQGAELSTNTLDISTLPPDAQAALRAAGDAFKEPTTKHTVNGH